MASLHTLFSLGTGVLRHSAGVTYVCTSSKARANITLIATESIIEGVGAQQQKMKWLFFRQLGENFRKKVLALNFSMRSMQIKDLEILGELLDWQQ